MFVLTLTGWLTTHSQSDTATLKAFGNSCQSVLDSNKTTIHYSYTGLTQTHDYSNNWDFDGDGETDGLYFIGTGGAHLHFYLRIILSSDKKIRNFPFLELDFPCVGSVSELKSSSFYPPPFFPRFVVNDFNTGAPGDNANDKIYLHLDSHSEIPAVWKKRGVSSSYLLLLYEKGEIIIKNSTK